MILYNLAIENKTITTTISLIKSLGNYKKYFKIRKICMEIILLINNKIKLLVVTYNKNKNNKIK
jgi:hypothetical protein